MLEVEGAASDPAGAGALLPSSKVFMPIFLFFEHGFYALTTVFIEFFM